MNYLVSSISPRCVINIVLYGHGEALIDFIKDCKLSISNGWLDPCNGNSIYISDKGKSMEDYIITPQDCLDKCVSFKVQTMNEVCLKYNLACYI